MENPSDVIESIPAFPVDDRRVESSWSKTNPALQVWVMVGFLRGSTTAPRCPRSFVPFSTGVWQWRDVCGVSCVIFSIGRGGCLFWIVERWLEIESSNGGRNCDLSSSLFRRLRAACFSGCLGGG